MSSATPFEIGIFTFGELTRGADGTRIPADQRLRDPAVRSALHRDAPPSKNKAGKGSS